ncbi:hypothetical protein CROQUDRAFT_557737 [Cronartium quercuum f. sp. fusiforme G11]|uniref:Uncharacterized protein n=1 Tax=Cronartium quercuum f. sp. fusiforme G11 TaxID=708437 RepID=A0A9P6NGZ3_9BASI|nr:hypothetical protein CROQUDRAFT_557737 [Cronartium quercuum f. sp. fusiforme G11]
MNNAGIDSMKMKKVETKKVDPIINRSSGLSVTHNPVASTSKTLVIGNKRAPATTQLINGKNKQLIVGSSKTELVSQPIASSSSNKTLVTKSSDKNVPLKLKSPTKRAHAFGSATQPRKVLPQPTKPTWQPKTIVRNSKILPNGNKPSIIPQPISRYTASTRMGIGKTNTIRSVIRSTNASNLPKACKNNRILNEGGSGSQVIVKDTGKRALDEDEDVDEDELLPRSQKKIKVS